MNNSVFLDQNKQRTEEDNFNSENIELSVKHSKTRDIIPQDTNPLCFRKLMNKLNISIVLTRIGNANSLLERVESRSAPQILCFTNIDSSSSLDDRYFTQIFINKASEKLDLLSDPYLLIEGYSKSRIINIFWSNLEGKYMLVHLSADEPELTTHFAKNFSSVFSDFLERNLSFIDDYISSELTQQTAVQNFEY